MFWKHPGRTASKKVIDGSQTLVSGENLLTLMACLDNEWGYANVEAPEDNDDVWNLKYKRVKDRRNKMGGGSL